MKRKDSFARKIVFILTAWIMMLYNTGMVLKPFMKSETTVKTISSTWEISVGDEVVEKGYDVYDDDGNFVESITTWSKWDEG